MAGTSLRIQNKDTCDSQFRGAGIFFCIPNVPASNILFYVPTEHKIRKQPFYANILSSCNRITRALWKQYTSIMPIKRRIFHEYSNENFETRRKSSGQYCHLDCRPTGKEEVSICQRNCMKKSCVLAKTKSAKAA